MKKYGLVVLVLSSILSGMEQSQAAATSEKMDLLKAFDEAFLENYLIHCIKEGPATLLNPQGCGQATGEIVITGSLGGVSALQYRLVDISYPPFVDQGPLSSVRLVENDEGNYEFSCLNKLDIYFPDNDAGTVGSEHFNAVITPANELLKKAYVPPRVKIYPKDRNEDLQGSFYPSLLALGRGYSGFIEEVVHVSDYAPGAIRIEGRGRHFYRGAAGTWVLEVVPDLGYLVRKATFRYPGKDEPEVIYSGDYDLEARGKETGLPLWQSGEILSSVSGNTCISRFLLAEYSRSCNQTLVDEVKQSVEQRYDHLVIRDHRLIDRDGKPLMRTVGEGDHLDSLKGVPEH